MTAEPSKIPRAIWWAAALFAAITFLTSWWHWWTFQYGTFDLAFYVQALWLALRAKWTVSLLNVPLMGNHAEPIVFLLAPLFAVCPHPMLLVAVQTLALASMPFTAWRIAQRLGLEKNASLCLALTTVLTPAAFSIGIYEFHPEALAAPLLLCLVEARLAQNPRLFWLWFLAVLGVKENMALLLIVFCAVHFVIEWKRGRDWLLRWNLVPAGIAAAWLLFCGRVLSPWLNAGNVDYLQLYGHLGTSGTDILTKFFTEPHRLLAALKTALFSHSHIPASQGDLLPALLLPLLLLPLLRPRWLLISAPLLAQHLLSWRYSEWTLGAHYPAPFLALFWAAAAEALTKFRRQSAIAVAVLFVCVLSHFRFGAAREIVAEIPGLNAALEEREWKAQMLGDIPADASVTASLAFLPHLAKRGHLISLHHILKGLKTLSITAFEPPPPGDVVVIDYGDRLTFNTGAGYYHPWSHVDATHSIPSSDRLLHEYLRQAKWHAVSRNELTVLTRGKPAAEFAPDSPPLQLDETTALAAIQVSKRLPGALQLRFAWDFSGERKRFPWLMLVLSDGRHLFPFTRGMCAPEAGAGRYFEEWSLVFPSSLPAGYYAIFADFYDGNEAAWKKKFPPDDMTFLFTRLHLGDAQLVPGNFIPAQP